MSIQSNIALKEWAIVVEALAAGEQMILVRKGGIRDPRGTFQLKHREFLLYPTWEHQAEDPQWIRPEFQPRLKELLAQPRDSSTVPLTVYAGVAFCGQIQDPKRIAGLERYHLWTPGFFEARMSYRPKEPTLVVVLRAYRIPKPTLHPIRPEYAGCQSWVELSESIPVDGLKPVVENDRFREALEEISARL